MGLEVGWYLRFAKTNVVEALVRPDTLTQVQSALLTVPGWHLETEERGGHVLARFTRIVEQE